VSTGGVDWASAGPLTMGDSNTFDLTDTVAGGTQPYWSGWWSYTPAADTRLTLDTNATEAGNPSTADTQLFVFSGTSGSPVPVDDDDDSGTGFLSSLTLTLTGGVEYHIQVGSYDPDGDTITRFHLTATPLTPAERPVYSIGGITIPVGGDRVATAGEVTPLSVTYPTEGFVTDEGSGFVGDPHVWYKLTAPITGNIILDTQLSSALYVEEAGPAFVRFAVYRSDVGDSPTTITDCTNVVFTTADSYTLAAVAGETYLIVLWRFPTEDAEDFILRVSDYGTDTPWTQPADQQWWKGWDAQGQLLPPNPLEPLIWATAPYGFHGRYSLLQALLGDDPTFDSDAADCLWATSTVYNGGFRFWTDDGSGEGTSPGACVPPSVILDATDDPAVVGAVYSGSPGSFGIPSEARFDVWDNVARYWVTKDVNALGPTGGLDEPALPEVGATVEYEAEVPTLLGVDAAPDQASSDDTDIIVRYYGTAVDVVENPDQHWGPSSDGSDHTFATDSDGPLGFIGSQDYQLPDYPPDGSSVGWTAVPSDVLTSALGFEAAWQVSEDTLPPDELDTISDYMGGLRWVGLFPEQTLPDPPGQATPAFSPPETQTDLRHDQLIAVRLRVRPPRYRFHLPPVIPPVDAGDVTRLWPRNDGLGASSSERTDTTTPASRVFARWD
jgi:hypothetical protein